MHMSRKFSVHPQMIFSLITAQAGTLGKAVLENIMNSVDAGATKMSIDITRDKITIVDDGHGFRSVQEIEECFEVFGFPHEQGARLYGQFGIGRAQLWSFSSAIWRTNTFTMDVDIKNRGLDYHLKEGQRQVDGLHIVSKFYTKMSTHDIQVFKQELKELALYTQIPVLLNGELLNASPTSVKWNHETDDAWIKLTDSQSLTVYNLGVLVKKYPAYQVGSGGVVVTKPGVRLALNMARNDILVSECKVWARIKPFIQKKSDEKVRRKTTRLSKDELENRASRVLSGDVVLDAVKELKLITDITGRSHTLQEFLTSDRGHGIFSTAAVGSNLGDRAHASKLASVVHPDTFPRFGVETLTELMAALDEAMRAQPTIPHWYTCSLVNRQVHEDLAEAVPSLRDGYEVLPLKEWTKKEKATLRALGRITWQLKSYIRRYAEGDGYNDMSNRALHVGLSDTALAWTDAKSTIVFSRDLLAKADKGFDAFVKFVGVLLHEYLHDSSSAGSHIHDETFYKRFHDVHQVAPIGEMAFEAYRCYISYLGAMKVTPAKYTLKALLLAEDLDARPEPEPEPVQERPRLVA